MGILQQWRDKAYNEKANKGDLQRMWADYFAKEKSIYAEILKIIKRLGRSKQITKNF